MVTLGRKRTHTFTHNVATAIVEHVNGFVLPHIKQRIDPIAYDNTVTLVGNVTRDPELRFTPSGAAVANFGVAWNRKGKDEEDVTSFFDVTCWNQLAENVAESIEKGMRVVIYGRLDQRSWENQDGEKRSKVEIVADEVSPSLRWATASVEKNAKGSTGAASKSEPVKAYDPSEEPF